MDNDVLHAAVFVPTEGGASFHESERCASDTVRNRDVMSLEQAVDEGFTPCGNCVGEEFRIVADDLRITYVDGDDEDDDENDGPPECQRCDGVELAELPEDPLLPGYVDVYKCPECREVYEHDTDADELTVME